MHYLALVVIAIHTILPYSLPFSGNNKNVVIKISIVTKGYFPATEKKALNHAENYERQSHHHLFNAESSPFTHPIQLFTKNVYEHNNEDKARLTSKN